MQPSLQAEIGKFVDTLLNEEDVLPKAVDFFKADLAPKVQNVEDAVYGYVFGRVVQFAGDLITVKEQRAANMQERLEVAKEVAKVMERKALEIKSVIRALANR